MSTYYQYNNAKYVLAQELRQNGWTIYDYHKGHSQPEYDIYEADYWGGVAAKNGYILCIDTSSPEKERFKDNKLIVPEHMANPKHCNWHIERNGVIYDKGSGILKFASLRTVHNLSELRPEFRQTYHQRYLKTTSDLKQWIGRINSIASKTVDELKGTEFKTGNKTVTRTVYTAEPCNGAIAVGQYIQLMCNFTRGCDKGTVYRITSIDPRGFVSAVRLNSKLTKECTGTSVRGNWFTAFKTTLEEFIANGNVIFCKIVSIQKTVTMETLSR